MFAFGVFQIHALLFQRSVRDSAYLIRMRMFITWIVLIESIVAKFLYKTFQKNPKDVAMLCNEILNEVQPVEELILPNSCLPLEKSE